MPGAAPPPCQVILPASHACKQLTNQYERAARLITKARRAGDQLPSASRRATRTPSSSSERPRGVAQPLAGGPARRVAPRPRVAVPSTGRARVRRKSREGWPEDGPQPQDAGFAEAARADAEASHMIRRYDGRRASWSLTLGCACVYECCVGHVSQANGVQPGFTGANGAPGANPAPHPSHACQ